MWEVPCSSVLWWAAGLTGNRNPQPFSLLPAPEAIKIITGHSSQHQRDVVNANVVPIRTAIASTVTAIIFRRGGPIRAPGCNVSLFRHIFSPPERELIKPV